MIYVYAESKVIIGQLAERHEPGAFDLCRQHSQAMSAPRGWQLVRLNNSARSAAAIPNKDDIAALADVVREIEKRAKARQEAQRKASQNNRGAAKDRPANSSRGKTSGSSGIKSEAKHPDGVVELARRGHLSVLTDINRFPS